MAAPERRRRSTSAGRSSTRRCASSPARASTRPASRTSPTRPASPTGSSTTTSPPRTQVLNELFSERWSLLLAAIDEADRERRQPAREARRGGRLHRRLLPPRPGADEGDHRRGDAGRQLVRPHPPARRSARPTTRSRRSSPTGQEAGLPPRHRPDLRLDVLLRGDRAAPLGLDLRADPRLRRRLRARQGARRARRSATASSRGLAAVWESLAHDPRQDRVLHGAAKLLNVVVGLVALPALAARAADRRPAAAPARPRGAAQAELAGRRRRRALDGGARWPSSRRSLAVLRSSPWAEPRKGLRDISTFVLTQHRVAADLGYAYPRQFYDHVFEGADGIRIGASLALHETPAPGADRRPRPLLDPPLRLRARISPCAPTTSGASTSPPSTCGASA